MADAVRKSWEKCDKVDDIPGVPGVGPVKAKAIFGECLGLEAVRDGFPILSSKHQKLLDGHLEEMFRWRELTALRRTELPGVTLDDLAVRVVDVEAALALAECVVCPQGARGKFQAHPVGVVRPFRGGGKSPAEGCLRDCYHVVFDA